MRNIWQSFDWDLYKKYICRDVDGPRVSRTEGTVRERKNKYCILMAWNLKKCEESICRAGIGKQTWRLWGGGGKGDELRD